LVVSITSSFSSFSALFISARVGGVPVTIATASFGVSCLSWSFACVDSCNVESSSFRDRGIIGNSGDRPDSSSSSSSSM